jgi:hypothetical protein
MSLKWGASVAWSNMRSDYASDFEHFTKKTTVSREASRDAGVTPNRRLQHNPMYFWAIWQQAPA